MTPPHPREPGAFFFDVDKGIIGIDIETVSGAEIVDYGAWAYSRHPSTRVYVVSWAYAESGETIGPVHRWYPGDTLPPEFVDYVTAGGCLLAHNTSFEIAIWSNILLPRFDWPPFELAQWRDSQASGSELNLPAKLEGLATALGAKVQKDNAGKKLMLRLAKAKTLPGGMIDYPTVSPAELDRLSQYCDDDVLAMLHCWYLMPAMSVRELAIWSLDKRINLRGVYLDRAFAERLRTMAERRSRRLARLAQRSSRYELADSVAPPALKRWLKSHGVDLPRVRKHSKATGKWYWSESTDKRALAEILERRDLKPMVREVLENRQEATKTTSLRKLRRVELMVGGDGRLRNALRYGAASTMRWSSSGLQVHNLPKDRLSPAASERVDLAVERDDLDMLEAHEKRPLEALSQKLRSVVAAAPGHDLIAADFASVEACVCAWLAGHTEKLDFLRDYFVELKRYTRGERMDKPQDLYEFTAESIGSDKRQLGKVAELALQYQMGGLKFADTAAGWGVPLDVSTASQVQKAWRATNRCIVDLWSALHDAAMAAVRERNTSHLVGRLSVRANESCLFIVTPSGGALRYWRPAIVHKTKTVKWYDTDVGEVVEHEFEGPQLQFWSQNDAKSGMSTEDTYGGKLVENVVQRVARDLLGDALLRLESAGYPIVMHVHDSAAAEVPEGTGDVDEFCAIMAEVPRWAEGCPVAADGYRAKRFRG